jgi:hypothetical protein
MSICPHCGRSYFCLNIECPHCGKRIVSYFTINAFFRDNFHYFTIIGVIGTMIALLPTIGEKIVGNNWLISNISLLSISLTFLFLFGALLLFGIFIILLKKIWNKKCRYQEDPVLDHPYLSWLKRGDKSRLMLTFCLFPMMLSLIGFLVFVLIYNPSDFVKFVTLLILIMILFISYGYIIITSIVWGLIRLFLKNKTHGILAIVGLIIVAVVYVYIASNSPHAAPPNYPIPQEIKIISSPPLYHPQISSEQGLLIEAQNTDVLTYGINSVHWSTNYGYFVQISPNSKMILLGNDTTQYLLDIMGNQKIYWIYPISDLGKDKPPVKIYFEMIRKPNDTVIANSTLSLKWIDKDIISADN